MVKKKRGSRGRRWKETCSSFSIVRAKKEKRYICGSSQCHGANNPIILPAPTLALFFSNPVPDHVHTVSLWPGQTARRERRGLICRWEEMLFEFQWSCKHSFTFRYLLHPVQGRCGAWSLEPIPGVIVGEGCQSITGQLQMFSNFFCIILFCIYFFEKSVRKIVFVWSWIYGHRDYCQSD